MFVEVGPRPAVSELGSMIDALRAETLPELPDARLEEDFFELHRAVEQLEAERLRRLGEIDRRRLYERNGHLSGASWLASRFGVAWGAARSSVGMARALEQMPGTRGALEAGEVSLSAVRVLVEAYQGDPEPFAASESLLVEAARIHAVGELRRVVALWHERVVRERGPEGEDPQWTRRGLHASATLGGMVRVDGDLDPETGESLLTALGAVLDAEARSGTPEDRRSPAQRRSDALGEICRQWLGGTSRPLVAGERPHLTVTVGVDSLGVGTVSELGAPGEGASELDHTGPVRAELARRLACDASVRRVVLGPGSEPLDVGRATPVVPAGLRRAVIARDRHCTFPGCDRPQGWCDAHHVVHWADGGPTSLANLLLLCRRHHRLVHEPGGFGLTLEEGVPVFRRPDGSVLGEERGPP